jgi:hypothetical protein
MIPGDLLRPVGAAPVRHHHERLGTFGRELVEQSGKVGGLVEARDDDQRSEDVWNVIRDSGAHFVFYTKNYTTG